MHITVTRKRESKFIMCIESQIQVAIPGTTMVLWLYGLVNHAKQRYSYT